MTDITIAQLTNSTAINDGTGVFDVLIKTVERRVENQFQKGRLAGTDYAQVYLGALQTVLQQSIGYLLAEQKAGLDADLVSEQILGAQSQKEDARNAAQATLEKQWGYAVTRDPTTGDNILNASAGDGLVDLNRTKEQETIDGLIAKSAETYSQVALLDQKQITELAQTTNPTGGVAKATYDKILAEGALLQSKKATEDENVTPTIGSLVDNQVKLYEAQVKGFTGKHENELLKTMLDTWAVVFSIKDGDLSLTDVGVPAFLEQTVIQQGGLSGIADIDAQVTTSGNVYP